MASIALILQYFLLNLAASFLNSASHNALHFLLGLTTIPIHFLHYLVTFLVLLLSRNAGLLSEESLPLSTVLPVAISQLCVTFLTSICHSMDREGGLYLLRLQDFAVTFFVILIAHKLLACSSYLPTKPKLLLLIAVGSSLSWLEFGILEYDNLGLLASPLNAFIQAIHIVLTIRTMEMLDSSFDTFLLYVTGLTSLFLALPATYVTVRNGGVLYSSMSTRSSWESIDYILLGMSIVFMCGYIHSEYWLMTHLAIDDYLVFRHGKFTIGSIGQWFTQNMAHSTVYSFCGKAIAIMSTLCFLAEKINDPKKSVKFSPAVN